MLIRQTFLTWICRNFRKFTWISWNTKIWFNCNTNHRCALKTDYQTTCSWQNVGLWFGERSSSLHQNGVTWRSNRIESCCKFLSNRQHFRKKTSCTDIEIACFKWQTSPRRSDLTQKLLARHKDSSCCKVMAPLDRHVTFVELVDANVATSFILNVHI